MNFTPVLRPWPHVGVRWLLLLVGGLLVIDSLWLVTMHVTNTGVMVPAVVGLVLLALGLWGAAWQQWVAARGWRRHLWRWGRLGFAVWLLTVAAWFVVVSRIAAGGTPDREPQAIIVLGATALNGKPAPTLALRLQTALQWANQYPRIPVVVSGGLDFRQTVTEAQAMAEYLQSLGLDPRRIVLEDKSTSTHENMVFSAKVLQTMGVRQDAPILMVTSDFHTLRAGWIATRAGWSHVHAVGSPTPLYLRYNAWLREYFACISGLLLREF